MKLYIIPINKEIVSIAKYTRRNKNRYKDILDFRCQAPVLVPIILTSHMCALSGPLFSPL